MRRDMIAIAEKERDTIPSAYELTLGELQSLYAMGKDGKMVEAFGMAFRYGFALGQRAAKRDAKRRRQVRASPTRTAQTNSDEKQRRPQITGDP